MGLIENIRSKLFTLMDNDYHPIVLYCTVGFYDLLAEEAYNNYRMSSISALIYDRPNIELQIQISDITAFYCYPDLLVTYSELKLIPTYSLDEMKKALRIT